MSKKTASFGASYTTSIDVASQAKSSEETYRVRVGNGTSLVGIYNWDFTYIDTHVNSVINEISSSTILQMQIMFKYNNNNDGIKMSFLKYEGIDPKFASGAQVLDSIQVTELAAADILSTNKTGLTIDLDDTDFFYYESLLNIVARGSITVAMQRHSDLDSSSGDLELGGQNLVGGSSEWRSATPAEPIDPPLLIVTYNVATESHPRLNMKFTTSDPINNQTVAANSLGKYRALNNVAPSSPIDVSINSTQVTIPIDTGFALPTKVGLGSVGPEVFQYTGIDTTNHQLTGVVRGISPNPFPAGFDAFRNPEDVYFLHRDASDLHLLFDTRPASDLVQYRCVAISNSDSTDDFNIKEGVIGIAQDTTSQSQIVIGVEFPKWDTITGVATDGDNSNADELFVTTDATIISKANGFYDGALLKMTSPLGVASYTVADSFVINANDGSGEFIISPGVTGLAAGWDFVLLPAPAQQIPNDATAPTETTGRFIGFSNNVEGIPVQLVDHGTTMQEFDLFYVWIRRTLAADTEGSSDTGAVLIFRYRDI